MKKLSTLLVVMSALAISGCDSDDSDPIPPPPAPGSTTIQVLHASPDAPAVDVLVNGDATFEGVDFAQSSGWTSLIEGSYDVEVQGILPDGNASVIGPVTLDLAADTRYTVAAVNSVSAIEPVVITQPDDSPAAGAARLFVLHGSAAAPSVDVYVTAPGADLTAEAPTGTFAFTETIGPLKSPPATTRFA